MFVFGEDDDGAPFEMTSSKLRGMRGIVQC